MKVTNDTLCNIIEDTDTVLYQSLGQMVLDIEKEKNKTWGRELLNNAYIHFLTNKSTRKIILSSTVRNNINDCKIDLDKDFRFDVLRTLPNRYDTIQMEERVCFKYHKTDYSIFCMVFRSPNGKDIETTDFFISLIEKEGQEYITTSLNKVHDEDLDLFLRTITFLELTDVSLRFVKPKEKFGIITKGNFIKNTSNHGIIHVNSTWNIETVRIGTINVRGHWRLQPYGSIDNRYYKYKFIEPFKRGHTKRLSQKEIVEHKLKNVS